MKASVAKTFCPDYGVVIVAIIVASLPRFCNSDDEQPVDL
jgi:hypothetical protein